MRLLVIVAAGLFAGAGFAAAPAKFPAYITLPTVVKAKGEVEVESYGQVEFTLRDKTEVYRGRKWSGSVDTTGLGTDERRNLGQIVEAMIRGGWQVMLRDEPRNPPLATFKMVKDGKEVWASTEGGPEEVMLIVLERSGPSVKLQLESPAAGIEKVPERSDFPFLKRFPASQLAASVRDDRPLLVALESDRDPVQVAAATVRKEYKVSPGTGRLDVIAVYREALKAAGWQIVDENTAITTGDPNLTARYAKHTVDLWVHAHATGEGYSLSVGDAGAERAPGKLKAELDKTCKVAIYGVHFDFDKSTLRADSEPALGALLKLLNDYADLKVELGGHTDNVGKRDYNAKLSEARVNTVRGWLVGKGVTADRLTAKGYADTQAIETNETSEGRAKNRRVELRRADCRK